MGGEEPRQRQQRRLLEDSITSSRFRKQGSRVLLIWFSPDCVADRRGIPLQANWTGMGRDVASIKRTQTHGVEKKVSS